jgi:glyoxylase I family protein
VVQGFEHVGMTSSNLDETIAFYCGLLGLKEVLVKSTGEGGRIAFLEIGGVMLEIVQPGASVRPASATSPSGSTTSRRLTRRFVPQASSSPFLRARRRTPN